eukprot:m.435002 g.435002  ORF g.435002 m.435002 type:complete len:155 (-) comp17796_c0_seq1:96-560(-)
MCSPLRKTDGTVRCPVCSASACWIAPPSSLSSSSITTGLMPAATKAFFALTQNGQYDLEKTTTEAAATVASTISRGDILGLGVALGDSGWILSSFKKTLNFIFHLLHEGSQRVRIWTKRMFWTILSSLLRPRHRYCALHDVNVEVRCRWEGVPL